MGEETKAARGVVMDPHAPDHTVTEDHDMASPKSTKSPAYQFYPGDFLKDENVLLMSYTEIGIYQVLLCHAWTNRGLPNDLAAIATMLKFPHKRLTKMWAGPLGKCFVVRGERLVNPRQEQERNKQAEFRRRQSDNGSRGGRPLKSQREPTDNPSLSSGKARALKTEDLSCSPVLENKGERLDVAFAAFRDLYPANRRQGGMLVQQAFMREAAKAGSAAALMTALVNHVASEQWTDPQVIPGMDTWLDKEHWRRTLAPKGSAPARDNRPAWVQRAKAAAEAAK